MENHRHSAKTTEDLLLEIQENHPDIDFGKTLSEALSRVPQNAPEPEIRKELARNLREACFREIPSFRDELGYVNFDVIAAQTMRLLRPLRLKGEDGRAVLAQAAEIPDIAAKMASSWTDGSRLMVMMAQAANGRNPEIREFAENAVSCERIDPPKNHELEKSVWKRCAEILKKMLKPLRNAMFAAIAFSSIWGVVNAHLPEMKENGDFRPAIERIIQSDELGSAIRDDGLLSNFMKAAENADSAARADMVSDFWNNLGERFGLDGALPDGALSKYALLRQLGADKDSMSIMEAPDGKGGYEFLLVMNAGGRDQKAYGSKARKKMPIEKFGNGVKIPNADAVKTLKSLDLSETLGRVLSAASSRADMAYEDAQENFRREVFRELVEKGVHKMDAFEMKEVKDVIRDFRQMRIMIEGGHHAGQYTLLPWSAPDAIRELGAQGADRDALGEKFAKCMLDGGKFEHRLQDGVKLTCSSIAPQQKQFARKFSDARKAWHEAEMSNSFRELSGLNFDVVFFGKKGVKDQPLAELGAAWKARPFQTGSFQGFLSDFREAINDGSLDRLFREDFALNALMKRLDGLSPADKVKEVDVFWNRVTYQKDEATYGQDEYWAKASEMWQNQMGDCEDYAIAKCATLLRAGFGKDDMQLLVGQTPKDGHAMLAVHLPDGWKILDNNPEDTFKAPNEKAAEYVPVAGINEDRVTAYAGPMKFRDPDGRIARPKMR